jgi:hypothetical protein
MPSQKEKNETKTKQKRGRKPGTGPVQTASVDELLYKNESLSKELEQLRSEADQLKSKAKEAKRNGDYDTYKSLSIKLDKKAKQIDTKRKTVNNNNTAIGEKQRPMEISQMEQEDQLMQERQRDRNQKEEINQLMSIDYLGEAQAMEDRTNESKANVRQVEADEAKEQKYGDEYDELQKQYRILNNQINYYSKPKKPIVKPGRVMRRDQLNEDKRQQSSDIEYKQPNVTPPEDLKRPIVKPGRVMRRDQLNEYQPQPPPVKFSITPQDYKITNVFQRPTPVKPGREMKKESESKVMFYEPEDTSDEVIFSRTNDREGEYKLYQEEKQKMKPGIVRKIKKPDENKYAYLDKKNNADLDENKHDNYSGWIGNRSMNGEPNVYAEITPIRRNNQPIDLIPLPSPEGEVKQILHEYDILKVRNNADENEFRDPALNARDYKYNIKADAGEDELPSSIISSGASGRSYQHSEISSIRNIEYEPSIPSSVGNRSWNSDLRSNAPFSDLDLNGQDDFKDDESVYDFNRNLNDEALSENAGLSFQDRINQRKRMMEIRNKRSNKNRGSKISTKVSEPSIDSVRNAKIQFKHPSRTYKTNQVNYIRQGNKTATEIFNQYAV